MDSEAVEKTGLGNYTFFSEEMTLFAAYLRSVEAVNPLEFSVNLLYSDRVIKTGSSLSFNR